MLTITNTASQELNKVLEANETKGKYLILYYMGAG